MTWAEIAKELADGAERARQEGDVVAEIVLLKGSLEAAQISKLLADPTEPNDEIKAMRRDYEEIQERKGEGDG